MASNKLIYVHCVPMPSWQANGHQVASMCGAFAERGGGVTLAAFRNPDLADKSLPDFYGLKDSFDVHFFPFPYRGGFLPVSLKSVLHLRRAFGRGWTCYTRTPSVALWACLLGIPTLLELHGPPFFRSERQVLPLLGRLPSLKSVIVISEALKRILRAQGYFKARPISVEHDGVFAGKFGRLPSRKEARAALRLPEDARIVGYAGTLSPGKGVETLLRAVSLRPADFLTVVVGQSPQYAWEDYRRRYGSQPGILWTGAVAPSDVPLYLRAFDVIVAPYQRGRLSDYSVGGGTVEMVITDFMSPLKVFEAMASGTPLVSTRLAVLEEVLEHDRNALLAEPADCEGLRAQIDRLLSDPALGLRLARKASEDVQRFDWGRRAERILSNALS